MHLRTWSLVGIVAIATATATAMEAGKTVLFHGNTVSTDVTVINGRAYVPLSDMARALGGKLKQRGNDYVIVTGSGGDGQNVPGGANEIKGQAGKVGDLMFNGFWRFQVQKVEHADAYTNRYFNTTGTWKPNSANEELVIVTCLIKNGHKETEEPILGAAASRNTALADDQGQSYPPLVYDVRTGSLLPGAGKTFAVVFSVPKETKLKSLVFTLYGYGVTSTKATDVRIALGDQ